MDAPGFGDVVGGLFLREVGNVAGHGGRDDKGAGLALAEMMAYGFGAVKCTSQICINDFLPRPDTCVQDPRISRLPRVSDEDVNFAKVSDDVFDELLDVFPVADLAFVGFAFDAEFFGEVFGVVFAAFGTGCVGDGEVGTHFGAAAGCFDANANGSGGAGHDDDFALEAEEVMDGVGFGDFDRHGGGIGGVSAV